MNRRNFLIHSVSATALSPTNKTFAVGSDVNKTKVLVIGAGLAGLNTARILEEQGWDTTVLEARSQAGGRTLSFASDTQNINMGGVEIGDRYDRFISLVEKHKLKLIAPDKGQPGLALFRQGQLFDSKEWESSNVNPLPEAFKSILPSRLQFGLHAKSMPFKSTTDWLNPKFADLDISEKQRLKQLGADESFLELVNRSGNFNQIDEVSSIHVMRALANFMLGKSKSTLRLDGGNDQLAMHMAKALNDVRYDHVVTKIEETRNGIEAICSNGQRFIAEKLVIAIPFSVLRNIDFDLKLTPQHLRAINYLPYTRITKLVVAVEKPFWESDGLPANMWCDSPLERCFLTIDNQGRPNYTLFINGIGTSELDKLPTEQAQQWMLDELSKVRPSTTNTVKPLAFHSWGNDPYAMGAYAAFGPGQVSDFANEMVKPAGNVYFAGEHCSRSASGLEGALESAEITAKQVLERA